ncbi:MAG: carboxylating nicotinate-nucleotide diphosphorylase [Chitinophagaceae bacterium]|jgi:nicotinate-nucleotide pyrophosphorylase (carboxylating)|nr:carboxylating nicotinate-nucleotide diphosphorylase [Chitinophagaceae bacterium]MCA6441199.1 carboxylating nicotinate-nucleotide diphosphorylase [Chitinophagaceae bacterium]MCA6447999.1 carboxylating nicotinate-nucleotide diphosphorylase [Chitinophagaceae bacterium]
MNHWDKAFHTLVDAALAEDIGDGDHSTLGCIPADSKGKAILKIKEPCIIAGITVAKKIVEKVEPTASFVFFAADGEQKQAGDIAFELSASIHTILKTERLVLNCMQRMSGIASLTAQYVSAIAGTKTKLLDTRKTTPNFRLLEKEAVRIGGGYNHRFGLYDMIMLKDNHIDYCGGLEAAIHKAYAYTSSLPNPLAIEVETRTVEDVKKVCDIGEGKVFRIMLDNFDIPSIKEALTIIHGRFETEASGGIRLDNIADYAATGVDYISAGGIIHQAKSVDLSLKAEL